MKVSIITPCYNSAATIGETLQSIAGQEYPSIEHIVVDGKSRDRTLEIIQQYEGGYRHADFGRRQGHLPRHQ